MAGKPITRKGGAVHPARPAGGVAAAAVTLTGTCNKGGAPCEFAWGVSPIDPPLTGWLAATTSTPEGNCSVVTVYPAAGAKYVWMRRTDFPRVGEAIGPVTVT